MQLRKSMNQGKNRIGIVGGGQLGRMMTAPAQKLGFKVTVIDPTPNSPAGQVADNQIIADYKAEKAIRQLGAISDYITFEIELANSKVLRDLEKNGVKINPSSETLEIIKDKLRQKIFLKKNKIPIADFVRVKNKSDISKAIENFGYPILLKSRFDAYDGRGNAKISNEQEIDSSLEKLKNKKLYVEKFIPFIKELSVIAVRSEDGEILTYPVVETIHKNNILHHLLSPAPIDKKIAEKARQLSIEVMKNLKGAGVFGIEMFLTSDNKILINEIAPRVHNSGHHTIEANVTSQFENHIRAITGLPLGRIENTHPASVMINILGDRSGIANPKGVKSAEKISGVTVHIYGKLETKPERKMGHITVVGDSIQDCLEKAKKARAFIAI